MTWMTRLTQSPDGLLHSNGEVCCILAVCCPPDAARTKLIAEMVKAGSSAEYATICADYVLTTFDLAPKGLVSPPDRLRGESREEALAML